MDKHELIHFETRFTTMPDLQMKLNQDNLEEIENLIQEIWESGYAAAQKDSEVQRLEFIEGIIEEIKLGESNGEQVKEALQVMKDFKF